jgi:hypothetical protein
MGLWEFVCSLFARRRRLDPALDPALLDQPEERWAPLVQGGWQEDPALLDHDTVDDSPSWDAFDPGLDNPSD